MNDATHRCIQHGGSLCFRASGGDWRDWRSVPPSLHHERDCRSLSPATDGHHSLVEDVSALEDLPPQSPRLPTFRALGIDSSPRLAAREQWASTWSNTSLQSRTPSRLLFP